MKRRSFIKQSALASSVLLAPSFVQSANSLVLNNNNYKRLIIVQLSGGNDGLNTIIPMMNDIYYKSRPSIGIMLVIQTQTDRILDLQIFGKPQAMRISF